MKKLLTAFVLCLVAVYFASCKGQQGPAGPPGASGTEFTAVFQYGIYPDPSYQQVDGYLHM